MRNEAKWDLSEGNEQTKTPQPKYVFPYCLPWGEFASGNGENFGL